MKGIDSDETVKSITSFSEQSAQAVNHMGTLGDLLHANGIAAGSMVDDAANFADLMAKTNTNAQKYQFLIEAG